MTNAAAVQTFATIALLGVALAVIAIATLRAEFAPQRPEPRGERWRWPLLLMSTDDEGKAAPPAGSRRGRTAPPMDRDRAYKILFRQKTIEMVSAWLEYMGVPLRDRRDIGQEVMEHGWKSWPTYDPMRGRPLKWLFQIAVHKASHYFGRAQHRREFLPAEMEDLEDIPDDQPDVGEKIDAARLPDATLALLQTLEPELRHVLVAHEIDGIPMQEIAEQLGIPLSTAYKWHARARQKLASPADRDADSAAAWHAALEAFDSVRTGR